MQESTADDVEKREHVQCWWKCKLIQPKNSEKSYHMNQLFYF